ncbi:MAG: TlpA family protein disulfide reductase [Prevotellaceae bacterium]|jgi:peroxiredoxin|nr:TlpA family protein disulfide reductase [Prevotellaceae bacterium]
MKKIPLFAAIAIAAILSCEKSKEIVKGDTVPKFSITSVEGETVKSEEFKGEYNLILFFTTWCPGCQMELPIVQSLYSEYKDVPNINFMAIAREQSSEEIAPFWQEKKYTMPLFADEDRSVYSKFAPVSIPRIYLVGPDGKVAYNTIGYNENETKTLIKMIREIAKNQKTAHGKFF